MIIKKKITIKECFRNYLFYLLINSIFVSNCNQTRRYDLFQFHGSPGTRKRNKQLYDKGEQICANTLFKPVASSEIKNDLSHLSYLVYTESGILNGHTSGFSIARVHYKSLRTFIEISFQRSLYIFSYYLASRIKKKLKTLQDIYDICHDHG